MLEIRSVRQDELTRVMLADQVLCGEEVTVRIGRNGFSLSYAQAFRAEWRSFPPDERLRIYAAADRCQFFAAGLDGRVAGIAATAMADNGWGELMDLRVDNACRGQGVGAALLEACEAAVRRHGLMGLRAAVPDSNPVLCQFLEHHGYSVQGMDRMALTPRETERRKPLQQRACLLYFYRMNEKG